MTQDSLERGNDIIKEIVRLKKDCNSLLNMKDHFIVYVVDTEGLGDSVIATTRTSYNNIFELTTSSLEDKIKILQEEFKGL